MRPNARENSIASSEKLVDILLAMGVVGVVAHAISPATQFITKFLEGENLWRWVAEPLLLHHARRLEKLASRRHKLFLERAGLPSTDDIVARLARMKHAGAEHQAIIDRKAIDRAEKAISRLRVKRYLSRPIKTAEFLAAVQALSEALKRNCSERTSLKPTASEQNYHDAERLDLLQREMSAKLAPYAIDIAKQREARAFEAREKLFAGAELAPTRLGNDVAALRSYCDSRYGIDFDFFWPRFLLVIQKNEKLNASLMAAKIQLDFFILSLALTVLLTATWLIIFATVGTSLIALLLVVALGPLATAMWLWLVHASYSAFAELVRSAIDISRFDVLQALRLPLPPTSEAERKVWERTSRLLILNEHHVDLTFKHPLP